MVFSFFKSKPVLADLIPDDHLDFHSHLLFGIDDGAKTPEEALELAQALQKTGCSQLIATPHIMYSVWDNTPEKILERLGQTRGFLHKNGCDVKLHAAAEYLMDSFFLKRLQREKLLTLKDNHVLVEMSYLNPPLQLFELLFEIQIAGYVPVLAHPERYAFYHRQFDEYRKIKDAGCLLQVNLLSTVGYYGESVARTAEKLLAQGLIDFAGSDVHHAKHIEALSRRLIINDSVPLTEALARNQLFRF